MVTSEYLRDLFEKDVKPKGWKMEAQFPNMDEEVFPHPENIFKALTLISPKETRFLILGQDPYYSSTNGVPDATGVAFATSGRKRQSLTRILKKVYFVGNENPELTDWIEKRGVLLLNAALTVPAGNNRISAGAHLKAGIWDGFIKSIISQVREANPEAKLIVWGKETRQALKSVLGNESYSWAHHPCASTKGPDSFNEFWCSEIGKALSLKITP